MLAQKLYSGSKLTTGGNKNSLLPKLVTAINNASEIEITVSFIQISGLVLLFDPLLDALNNNASIKLLTSDYLSITNPDALRQLLLLQERGAKIKVFECNKNISFHMKSYIFVKTKEKSIVEGCAYIGSNNISRTALLSGHEWCLRHDYEFPDDSIAAKEFSNIRAEFLHIFNHYSSKELSNEWIDAYQLRYLKNNKKKLLFAVENDETIDDVPDEIIPNSMQVLALQALSASREQGFQRGLVVLATGMGKTWLSAFDVKQLNAKKVLFVAHREEILLQAERTFIQLLSNADTGLYNGFIRQLKADYLFASIQTIGREEHLKKFSPEHFDYIVVDEFHHASAPTYKNLLAYFQPKFLLGLTATPERSDQADILSLCDNNLVFECNLVNGIDEKILVPFDYYGIYDRYVDYDEIPWRNGRFDPTLLDNAFATQKRANHIFENWQAKKQSRTLAFCVSKKHADYMAQYFSNKGFNSVAVYSNSIVRRNEALSLLAGGQIDIIFSVDLFNEGTDLPSIDTILMLRPTESKILFLQQLGRGLRQSKETNKEKLLVIDFIGNHNSFLNKPAGLFDASNVKNIVRNISEGIKLAKGCFINYEPELVEFWNVLAKKYRASTEEDYDELKILLGHRPTASEFFQHGYDFTKLRKKYGNWFSLVAKQEEDKKLRILVNKYGAFLLGAVETTNMTKSFKCILLESFLEFDGFVSPPTTQQLAERSWHILNRRPDIKEYDLTETIKKYKADSEKWHNHWMNNPINAFVSSKKITKTWFTIKNGYFQSNIEIDESDKESLHEMMQELIDFRWTQYARRIERKLHQRNQLSGSGNEENVINIKHESSFDSYLVDDIEEQKKYISSLPFYPLEIAAGGFADSEIDDDSKQWIDINKIKLSRSLSKDMFISQIHGHSMEPLIPDGSYCLFKYGVVGSRNGRVVLVKKTGYEDADTQASFTIKRYHSQKTAQSEFEWEHEKIELRPENPDYPVLIVEPDEAEDFIVIAEFLQVI